MQQLPSPDAVASASILIGALFFLRYSFALHRLRRESGRTRSFKFEDFLGAPKRGAFGPELEPERRHAARQYHAAMLFVGVGLVLFAWLISNGASISFGI